MGAALPRLQKRQQVHRGSQTATANLEQVVVRRELLPAEELELPASRLAPVTTGRSPVGRTIQICVGLDCDRGWHDGGHRGVRVRGPLRERLLVESQSLFHVAIEHQRTLLEHAHTPADGADRRGCM